MSGRIASEGRSILNVDDGDRIDLTHVDPRLVLAEIAGNPAQPASARVAAAKALLGAQQRAPAEDRDDFTNIRAVEMLAEMASCGHSADIRLFCIAGCPLSY
jgi:hypothetical protein